jgi:hypothetical protein
LIVHALQIFAEVQVWSARADAEKERTRCEPGSKQMTIAHQSAMTDRRVRARPPTVRSAHELVCVEPRPARTLAKIAGLVAVAAVGVALVAATVAGGVLFMLFNFR